MKRVLLLLLIILIFPFGADASNPRFNFLSGDEKLIQEQNVGNEFKGVVYYHNGVLDTVAHNTRVKVSISNETISAWLSADNATTISDTVVSDNKLKLVFIPGSVLWFPNESLLASPLPHDQNGDEIVSMNGLNIGDVQGCWQFAGHITFGLRAEPIPEPSSLLALGGGLFSLLGIIRRKK